MALTSNDFLPSADDSEELKKRAIQLLNDGVLGRSIPLPGVFGLKHHQGLHIDDPLQKSTVALMTVLF